MFVCVLYRKEDGFLYIYMYKEEEAKKYTPEGGQYYMCAHYFCIIYISLKYSKYIYVHTYIYTYKIHTRIIYVFQCLLVWTKSVFVGRTQTREVRDGVDMIGNR